MSSCAAKVISSSVSTVSLLFNSPIYILICGSSLTLILWLIAGFPLLSVIVFCNDMALLDCGLFSFATSFANNLVARTNSYCFYFLPTYRVPCVDMLFLLLIVEKLQLFFFLASLISFSIFCSFLACIVDKLFIPPARESVERMD